VVRYNLCVNDAVKLRQYGAIYVGNDGRGMSGVGVYHNTFVTNRADAGLDLKALFGIDAGDRDRSGRKVPSGKARDLGAMERPD
jgi:hypothetical protein